MVGGGGGGGGERDRLPGLHTNKPTGQTCMQLRVTRNMAGLSLIKSLGLLLRGFVLLGLVPYRVCPY